MKRSILSAALAVTMLSPAAADTVWYGDFMVTAVTTPACPVTTAAVGDFYFMSYRPAGFDNGADSQFNLIGGRGGLNFRLAGASFAPGATLAGLGVSGRVGFSGVSGNPVYTATLTAFTSQPAVPLVTSAQIILTGTVDNFLEAPGCQVSFRSYVVRRP